MIAHLRGKVLEKSTDSLIIDVSGVGYQVVASQTSLRAVGHAGSEVQMFIHTHVREDALTLFGFSTQEEKQIFTRLLNVSGVGPKLAMSILSGLAPADVVEAIVKEDLSSLNAISGIGRKTAERIILDLKDKFIKELGAFTPSASSNRPLFDDAVSALTNLGYARNVAEKTLAKIGMKGFDNVQSIVKVALKELKINS